MRWPILFALLTLGGMAVAQGGPSSTRSVATLAVDTPRTDSLAGEVTITIPPRVEALLEAYGEHKHPQKGYRVQIFLGERAAAETIKRSFLQKHPDTPAYLSWLAPNFRLRVGDLRTRLEAEHLLRDMKVLYPGSYIVPDEIEMPRLE